MHLATSLTPKQLTEFLLIGEYQMPEGSVVIAAGNRAEDQAIVRTMRNDGWSSPWW